MMRSFNSAMIGFIVGGLLLTIGYSNCAERASFSNSPSSTINTFTAQEAEYFLNLLDEARETVSRLNDIGTPQALAQANEIQKYIDQIVSLTDEQGSNLPYNDDTVQMFVDYLVHENAQGENLIIVVSFEEEIERLDRKDAQLDQKIDDLKAELTANINSEISTLRAEYQAADDALKSDIQGQIDALESQLAILEGQFTAFRSQVRNRFVKVENRIEVLNQSVKQQINLLIQQMQQSDQKLYNMIMVNRAKIVYVDGKYQVLTEDLKRQIQELDKSVDARFEVVDGKIVKLEERVVNIEDSIEEIQDKIEEYGSFIAQLETMIEEVSNDVTGLQAATASALAELRDSIQSVKDETQAQIVELRTAQNELKEALSKQQEELKELLESEKELADLQGLMCTLDSSGEVIGSKPACTGDEEDMLNGQCCLTVSVIRCEELYPGDNQAGARNSCNILKYSVQNLDDRVKAIAEENQQQNKLIAGIMDDVKNLSQQTEAITDTLVEVKQNVSNLNQGLAAAMDAISALDMRLMIEEFKSARSEAIAGINERSDHYLAWITRRQLDVRTRFCRHNAHVAYNRHDYEAARQNWQYCAERLRFLKEAKEIVHLIKAYTGGLGSLNVDQSCTAGISGVPADSLSDNELRQSEVSEQVIAKCQSGRALAKVYMLNVIALQNSLGPDFRTAAYMAKKAKIVQMLYFGSELATAPRSRILAFENIDPTSPEHKDTYYGKVERVFVNNYVKKRLRVAGEFPEDPNRLGSTSGLNKVYTHAQIMQASDDYLQRLKSQELEGHCGGECGFEVIGRNNVRKIGDRFSYPKDFKTQCPIWGDTVVIRSSDGKHYAYRLHYSRHRGATEVLRPHLYWNRNHRPFAESDADVADGKFRGCGYRVRNIVHRFGMANTFLRGRFTLQHSTPYAKSHGLPQCRKTWVRCDLWEGSDAEGRGSWVAPNASSSNLYHYLSGYTSSRIDNKCKESGASYVVKTRQLDDAEKNRLRVAPAQQDSRSLSYGRMISSTSSQLGQNYWMHQDRAISYGSGNDKVSNSRPFFEADSSHGLAFFRRYRKMSELFSRVDVQQCFDPTPPATAD